MDLLERREADHEMTDNKLLDTVTACMNAFTRVPRFETLLLFLSREERETARKVLQKISESSIGVNQAWSIIY